MKIGFENEATKLQILHCECRVYTSDRLRMLFDYFIYWSLLTGQQKVVSLMAITPPRHLIVIKFSKDKNQNILTEQMLKLTQKC